MKKILFSVLALVPMIAASDVQACMSQVSEHLYYQVNMAGTTTVKAETGDLISVSFSAPVIAKLPKIAIDSKILEVVADVNTTPPGLLGSSSRTLYLRVVGGGTTTVRVTLGKKTLLEQEVTATVKPTSKCM